MERIGEKRRPPPAHAGVIKLAEISYLWRRMMRWKILFPITALLLTAQVWAGQPSLFPPAVLSSIWLPAAASDIRYEEFGGTYQVFFNARVCYTAKEIIDDMVKAMNGRGWKRLMTDPLNPGRSLNHVTEPSGLAWNHVIDTKDEIARHYFG